MKFTLHYRGPLRANGNSTQKHDLRKHFHIQLKKLWDQKPLSEQKYLLQPRDIDNISIIRPIGKFEFAPLVTEEMNVIAELDIILLRPELPGNLLAQGGDIDNRLKTLFDALSMPQQTNSLDASATPEANEKPFYCLLENDNLVTSVAVRTEQLLEQVDDLRLVDATIHVRTRTTRQTFKNGSFG